MKFGQTEGNFDANITNNDLEVAYVEILSHLKGWYPTRFTDWSECCNKGAEFGEIFTIYIKLTAVSQLLLLSEGLSFIEWDSFMIRYVLYSIKLDLVL